MARQAAALHDAVVSQWTGLPAGETEPVKDGGAGKRRDARGLYWQGWRLSHISEHLNIPRGTLHGWLKAEKWNEAKPVERVEATLEARLVSLIAKDQKTGGDYKEIDLLGRQMERLARIGKYEKTGREVDLNPNIERRNAGPKKAPVSANSFTDEEIENMRSAFFESLYPHQRVWWDNRNHRSRGILKSRQIGATHYFSLEAFFDALETDRNQIFLSASKKQAFQFKTYINKFIYPIVGKTLKGETVKLGNNNAELIFLGTNARTAQSYSGNFYCDEFFWIANFKELFKVARAMATHKHLRKTYFSTPSSINHEAYEFWSAAHLKKGHRGAPPLEMDISHARLAHGCMCEDHVWRQIVTVRDAIDSGFDRIDLNDVLNDYSEEEFDNLYMCGFIDDSHSLFPMAILQPCMVDSWEVWSDFKPFTQRPLGYEPVWIGYDPSHTGDSAGLVIVAPPSSSYGKFRVLHVEQYKGSDFEAQAKAIKQFTEKYNVTNISIDTTGMGQGVYQLVQKFFPHVQGINYSVESKTRLVMKAQQVIRSHRLEFDRGDKDLAMHLLAIKRELTSSGRNVTYSAGRSGSTGHADLGWSLMNALSNEPLEAGTGLASETSESFLAFSE